MSDSWQRLVGEYDQYIGSVYKNKQSGHLFTFAGLLHADDDYYYYMSNPFQTVLESCVGVLESQWDLVETSDHYRRVKHIT